MARFLDWLDRKTNYKHKYHARYYDFRWRHRKLYNNIDDAISWAIVLDGVVLLFGVFILFTVVLVNVINTPNCNTAANYFGMGYTNNLLTGCNIEVEPGKFMPLTMIKYDVTP